MISVFVLNICLCLRILCGVLYKQYSFLSFLDIVQKITGAVTIAVAVFAGVMLVVELVNQIRVPAPEKVSRAADNKQRKERSGGKKK